MENKTVSQDLRKILTGSMHDAIIGGKVVKDIPSKLVYVNSQSELSNYSDYPVGTIAAVIGFGSVWQKNVSGEWVSI